MTINIYFHILSDSVSRPFTSKLDMVYCVQCHYVTCYNWEYFSITGDSIFMNTLSLYLNLNSTSVKYTADADK